MQEILSFEKSKFCTDVEFLLTELFLFNQDFRIDNVSYLVMKTYQKVSIMFFNCKTNITFYLEIGLNEIKKHSF